MKISFENYKIFKEKQSIELKPLTIFVGTNNSGKSSFTKMLFLLQNAFSNSYLSDLILNTNEINLGSFKDVISTGSNSSSIYIELNDKIRLQFSANEETGNDRLFLDRIIINEEVEIIPEQQIIYYDKVKGVYVNSENEDSEFSEILVEFKINFKKIDFNVNDIKTAKINELKRAKESIREKIFEEKELLETILNDDLKKSKTKEINKLETDLKNLEAEITKIKKEKELKEFNDIEVLFVSKYEEPLISNDMEDNEKESIKTDFNFWLNEKIDKTYCEISPNIEFIFSPVSLDSEINHLLSFERNTKSVITKSTEAINVYLSIICKFLKFNFSYSSSILRLRKRLIPFEDRVSKKFLDQYLDKQRLETLESFKIFKSDIVKLLNYFDEDIDDIEVKIVNGAAFEILINKRNINDFGDGLKNLLAQLLPIVLNNDTTYLIEEPEVRLHPKSQSFLADLFVSQINNNRFIIETHSEYFIRKLQLLLLQKKVKREQIGIYYFEREGEIREIEITNNAAISDFGGGFFDEASNLLLNLLIEQSKSQKDV